MKIGDLVERITTGRLGIITKVIKMNKDKQLKAKLPSGFQDTWGDALSLKKKILSIIERNFIKYGFSPLETSPMELSSIIGNSFTLPLMPSVPKYFFFFITNLIFQKLLELDLLV